MKLEIRYLVAWLFLLCTAGCASGPSYEQHVNTIQPPLPLDGRIYFYRTSSLGTGVQPSVSVNGEVVGTAGPKSFFFVDRPAGRYQVSTATGAEQSLSLTLDDGEVKFVRIEEKMGLFAGQIKLIPVDKNVGEQELRSTNYTVEPVFAAR
jgi:hypothetical protein